MVHESLAIQPSTGPFSQFVADKNNVSGLEAMALWKGYIERVETDQTELKSDLQTWMTRNGCHGVNIDVSYVVADGQFFVQSMQPWGNIHRGTGVHCDTLEFAHDKWVADAVFNSLKDYHASGQADATTTNSFQ